MRMTWLMDTHVNLKCLRHYKYPNFMKALFFDFPLGSDKLISPNPKFLTRGNFSICLASHARVGFEAIFCCLDGQEPL